MSLEFLGKSLLGIADSRGVVTHHKGSRFPGFSYTVGFVTDSIGDSDLGVLVGWLVNRVERLVVCAQRFWIFVFRVRRRIRNVR